MSGEHEDAILRERDRTYPLPATGTDFYAAPRPTAAHDAPTLAELLTRLCEAAEGEHDRECRFAHNDGNVGRPCRHDVVRKQLAQLGFTRDAEGIAAAHTLAAALVALEDARHGPTPNTICRPSGDLAEYCGGCAALRDAKALRARMGEEK